MAQPNDEVDSGINSIQGGEDAPEVVMELALEKEMDVKKIFAEVCSTVSPYTSSGSLDESAGSSLSKTDEKFSVVNKLQQKKWKFALIGLVLGLMILIATLAASSAKDDTTTNRNPFMILVQSEPPTALPTLRHTSSPFLSPTMLPSQSPSEAPSVYVPPITEAIQLRLYWESGYFWQESIFQTFWCMECADCPEYRIGDGQGITHLQNCTSPGDTTADCKAGNQIWLQPCKNPNRDFRFEFLQNQNSGFQIRAFNTSLCFSTVRNRFLEMRPCDNSKSSQLFNQIRSSTKFELRPYNQRDLPVNEAVCLSQLHHPKHSEMVGLHPCDKNIRDDTNYWEQYP